MSAMPPERFKPAVTVAAVIEHDGRFLMVEEATSEGLRLNNPAGHLEAGESPLDAVVREALEETTRRFVPEALLGVYLARTAGGDGRVDTTYVRFAFRGRVGEPLPGHRLDTGIVRTLWLSPDELRATRARHRSPLVMRGIEDHLAGRRFPLDLVYTDATVPALGGGPSPDTTVR